MRQLQEYLDKQRWKLHTIQIKFILVYLNFLLTQLYADRIQKIFAHSNKILSSEE